MKKMGIHQKTDEKTLLGTTFLGKHQIWGDFGVPGRSLGKALGRILGRNFGGGKNDEKTVVSAVASAGNADPGKEGFREDSQVGEMDRSNTPSLILTDGRADCLRFASPAEATGGLELGGLELGGLEEACKRLGRGLEYLVGMVLGAQIS